MTRFYLLLFTVLLSTASVAAQPTFRLGLRGGLNRATSTVEPASTSPSSQYYYSASKSAIYAWQAGAVLEVAFRRFALQPALVFSQKGEVFHMHTAFTGVAGTSRYSTRRVSRPNWLELPVNVVYTVHGVQLFAGPYVALAVGGKSRSAWRYTSSAPTVGPTESAYGGKIMHGDDTHNRRLDAGVNFGVGYRHGPMQAQFSYGLGLRNLHQKPNIHIIGENPDYHDFNADAAYNRVVQLTGTYFFKL